MTVATCTRVPLNTQGATDISQNTSFAAGLLISRMNMPVLGQVRRWRLAEQLRGRELGTRQRPSFTTDSS